MGIKPTRHTQKPIKAVAGRHIGYWELPNGGVYFSLSPGIGHPVSFAGTFCLRSLPT